MSLLSRLAVQAARAYGILSSRSNNISVDYLIVAGGGGGGYDAGGGGGAGGLLTSTATLSTLNTYSIAVGAGGNGSSSGSAKGSNGSNSSVSGTGLTTITSTGGGGGGTRGVGIYGGANGGSGGGEGGDNTGATGGTGTSGQGNNGGDNTTTGTGGAGGGGAGAAGSAHSGNSGGNGGNGSASSISGSSVTYAGGGGGGGQTTFIGGTGGTGGGGNGSASGAGTAGTANLGGGGGGGNNSPSAGGAGGSGIVIISYTSATPKFVGGTITTSGGKQIHTFTSSGTLSPITPITASYLVVAGGGGGGGSGTAGGGGAGGLLTSSTTLYSGATYVVTVGAGGSAGTTGNGGNGSNSVVSGTGLTTITSTGGGYGSANSTGASGGSGGGGGVGSQAGGTGTLGQGNNGGTGFSSTTGTTRGAGGGGGASAVGANGASGAGGTGGNGTASSISGSSVTYAGGGGGGSSAGSGTYAGGSGGGGAGSGSGTVNGVDGTTNLGGGGGGGGTTSGVANSNGGAGGSGIVIISYAGSQVFNGGLVTSSGGNTIHTFTSTGALTPLTNNLNNSLRFRSSASAYLSRTPTVAGNRKTWTLSYWTKRGALSVASVPFQAGSTGSEFAINWRGFDAWDFYEQTSSVQSAGATTNAVYRDPSAWYHIVFAYDTTQATAANRWKLYINGNQVTSFSATQYPTLNFDGYVNSTVPHYFGIRSGTTTPFDGYMADINFIDGQALEPYYFGNNDANGVWKPIQYKGTYGTNGFYLTFGNTTSTTTLGYDSSPNGNNWTCNNISLTAGTTYDAMTDVPTNTSATVANYAVINPLTLRSGTGTVSVTTSNANMTWNFQTSGASPQNYMVSGTIGMSSGKWYWEITPTTITATTGLNIGIGANPYSSTNFWATDGNSTEYFYVSNSGNKGNNGSSVTYGSTYTVNDVIGVALDMDAGTLTFYKNNVSQGTAFTGLTGTYFPFIACPSSAATDVVQVNFGQRPFTYTPPTGYVALNTYNLPTPTILQGNKYMDATLYTGNGSGQTIVNQALFKPDFVWVKSRSVSGNPVLVDSVRGANKVLYSPQTTAEETPTAGTAILSFNSNGFSLGGDISGTSFGSTNGNTFTYVGWQWQAGQGSTSSNTSGSITSTVSVNTTAGFSVATFNTGASGAKTVGHGLGVKPAMLIFKDRSNANNWLVWHQSYSNQAQGHQILNGTQAVVNDATIWNNTAPTSTVASIYSSYGFGTNANAVMYAWAEIAGFSKFGSYTGNGSADGPFVYLGFRPKFVMVKEYTQAGDYWMILDTSRDTYNIASAQIYPNASSAESSTGTLDMLSNGFKLRYTGGYGNNSGQSYIYMAFAEHPFKLSNSR